MKITDVCIERPVFAWMIMAATIVFGGVAFWRIGVSQYPDVDYPNINIGVTFEGASPEVVEHDVVETIEEAVTQVEGVRTITSSSRQGGANITVELDLSRNVDAALQEVQTKIAQVRQRLPRDVQEPTVSKNNPEDQPIMWVGLSGPYPRQILSDFARYRLRERLQTIEGVGEITMGGYLDRNVRIWLDADKLDARQVTVNEVIAALQREHVELPGGQIDTEGRELNVRILGEALDLATLKRIVVRDTGGSPVYLQDVSLVEDGFEDERRLSRVDGVPAQGLGVRKKRGANAVAVADKIKSELAKIQKSLPEGMQVGINFDSTKYIKESIHEIQFELLLAVFLTALVCWMFLGSLSSTLNVILAIPMSLLGTVAVIYFLGYTLNTFTLLALALAVGIVVDDAIMVMENIFRHGEGGKDRVRAAREGTHEITFAALAATLALVAIFVPVFFVGGVLGRFLLQFGVALSVAVMLSYVEAITLAPARMAQFVGAGHGQRGVLGRVVDRAFAALARAYSWALGYSVRFRFTVLAVAIVVIAACFSLVRKLPGEFVPSQDQSALMVRMQTAVGSDLGETDKLFQRAEAFVNNRPEIKRAFAVVGGFGGGGVNTGIMFLTLVPPKDRKMSQAQFMGVLRKELNSYPGLKAVILDLSQQGFGGARGFPIEFSVRGPDWDTLISLADDTREKLMASGMVVDLDTDYQVGMPELQITPNRAVAADLGVDVDAVARTISSLVGGVRVGKYSTGGRRIDVRLRLLHAQRQRPEDLGRLKVRTARGDLIPLDPLVKKEVRPTLQAITRKDRERAITIFGNVAPGHSQAEVLAHVEKLSREMPTGYRAVFSGASAQFKDSFKDAIFALIFGIVIAYMVLASQFNSFRDPLSVLVILFPSMAGAFLALWLGGKSLNMFSIIGIVLLMGIVKKNSIILVDYSAQARRRGLDARGAVLEAGPIRLRPILMTSIATMMAAVPSALALGPGAETRGPMAIAIIGGLILSTTLSLLIVPAFYVAVDDILGWLRRCYSRLHGHSRAQ
jgi:multidrug efflux pump